MWNADELCSLAGEALARLARDLDAEQAVRGLDALDELSIHPVLRAGYASAGLGVLSERPYPTPPRSRSRHSERPRCDLVLTPNPGQTLSDAVEDDRRLDRARGTLFEANASEPEPGAVEPESAYWLEVKTASQFAFVNGVPGPNRVYASALGAALADLPKLARDPRILRGGLMLVLLNADHPTAEHDAALFADRAASRGLLARVPAIERFSITDRIGNGVASVLLLEAARSR